MAATGTSPVRPIRTGLIRALVGELSQVKGSNFEVVKMRGMVTP